MLFRSTGNTTDIGLIGTFVSSGTKYTGILRDHTDSTWKFYNTATAPSLGSTQNFTGATYDGVKMGALSATTGSFTGDLTVGSSKFTVTASSGDTAVSGNLTVTGDLTVNGTGAVKVSSGTSAERPTAVEGMIRYNTDSTAYEGYDGTNWSSLGGGATGGGGDQVFNLNTMEVTTSYSLPTGKNAVSVGAITINSGVSVTIPSGQRWVIL